MDPPIFNHRQRHSLTSDRAAGRLEQLNSTDSYSETSDRGLKRKVSGASAPFQSAARKVRPGASRFSSAESRPFLPLLPTPCGKPTKAAYLLRRASGTFPREPLPSRVPEQSSPVAGDTLQTWPTGIRSVSLS